MPSRAHLAGAYDSGARHHVHVDWMVADSVCRDLPRVNCVGAAGAEHHTCDSPRPLICRTGKITVRPNLKSARISSPLEMRLDLIGPAHYIERS